MRHAILSAKARSDFTVELTFEGGDTGVVDLRDFVATGEVTEPLRNDVGLFVDGMVVGPGGAWISWPGDVDIDADSLWYQTHPGELERDYGPEAA